MKLKLKLPNIFQARSKKRKLRATATRKSMRAATAADYDEMAEPNMKLSRALLIVLLLHVVAVSGIIAFNAIKTRQSPVSSSTASSSPASDANSHPAAPKDSAHAESKLAHPAAAEKEVRKAKPVTASESGKTYVVAKGDTPANIAKKFKVPYDELLSVNHIDDPHKLQIGQKLIIPVKPPKAKKVANE